MSKQCNDGGAVAMLFLLVFLIFGVGFGYLTDSQKKELARENRLERERIMQLREDGGSSWDNSFLKK